MIDRINAELKSSPDDEELKLLLTKAYLTENNIDSAKDTLQDVIDNNSVSEEPYLALARIQLSQDERAQAEATLENGYTNVKNNRQILGVLTEFQIQDKKFDVVETIVKDALSVAQED